MYLLTLQASVICTAVQSEKKSLLLVVDSRYACTCLVACGCPFALFLVTSFSVILRMLWISPILCFSYTSSTG